MSPCFWCDHIQSWKLFIPGLMNDWMPGAMVPLVQLFRLCHTLCVNWKITCESSLSLSLSLVGLFGVPKSGQIVFCDLEHCVMLDVITHELVQSFPKSGNLCWLLWLEEGHPVWLSQYMWFQALPFAARPENMLNGSKTHCSPAELSSVYCESLFVQFFSLFKLYYMVGIRL